MGEMMRIMEDIKRRKVDLMKGSPCPECGQDNKCSMDAGESATLCWCMYVERTDNPMTDAQSCLCKSCLKGEVNE